MESGGFIGAYRLEQPIGEGGMGAVWKARHPTLDRPVALKLIRSEVKASPQAREAFLREVRVLSRLHGPQILHVTDFGFTEDGDPYMVTEFLEGEDLLARVRRAGPLGPAEAIEIGVEVLEALAEAHAVGLVHRDLKPGNVFLQKLAGGARTAVKVLDFGVAKLLEGDDEDTLWPGARLKGSPRYMAPEQITGGAITPATDIYAFGAMMYRVLTGKPLFGGDRDAVLRAHVRAAPPPMNGRAPGLAVPEELEDIVFGCLEKSPGDRPGSADALQIRMKRLGQRLRAAVEDEAGPAGLSLDWSGGELSGVDDGAAAGRGPLSSGSMPGLPPGGEGGARGEPGLDAWFQSTGELPVPPSDPPAAAAAPEPTPAPVSAGADGWGVGPESGGDLSETGPALELDHRPRPAVAGSMAGVSVPEGGLDLEQGGDAGLELAFEPASRGWGPPASPPAPEAAAEAPPPDPPPPAPPAAEAAPAPPAAEAAPDPAGGIPDRPGAYRPAPSVVVARVEGRPWHAQHRLPLIAGAAVVGLLLLVWIGRGALVGGLGVEPAAAVDAALDAAVDAEPRRLDLGEVPLPLDRGLAILEAPSVARGPAAHNGAPTPEQRPTVLIRPDPPPATFTRLDTGEVVCEAAATCRVPIDVDIRVTRPGYRALTLAGDDLYDRRGSSWRVILRR